MFCRLAALLEFLIQNDNTKRLHCVLDIGVKNWDEILALCRRGFQPQWTLDFTVFRCPNESLVMSV